jgi:hypothetical protein
MIAIAPTETVLEGRWHIVGGVIRADDVAIRIEQLVEDHLKFVASREGGWTRLYRDPADGRYWELSYPSSEMHGGGPPRLETIPLEVVHKQYGNVAEA